MSIKNLILELTNCLLPNFNTQEIAKKLTQFQDEITVQLFEHLETPEIISSLEEIWSAIFSIYAQSQTSIRIVVSKVCGAFLFKLTSFFPDELEVSLVHSIKKTTPSVHSKSGILIFASLEYILHYTSPPFIRSIVRTTPIIELITDNEVLNSEHISDLMENFPIKDSSWFESLLKEFSSKISQTQNSRMIIKVIAAIILHSPNDLFKIFLSIFPLNPFNISIISYVLHNSKQPIDQSKIDFSATISYCLTNIDKEDQSTSFYDNCLQILSVINNLNIEIDPNDQNCLVFTWKLIDASDDHNVLKELQQSIHYLHLIKRPTFFSLPIPETLLKIDQHDSFLMFSTKCNTLGKYSSLFPKKEYFELFLSYINRPYDNFVSSALGGLSKCINQFIQIYGEGLYREIILTHPHSWFHASDILKLIKSTNISNLSKFTARVVTSTLISFCFDKNEKLAGESLEFLPSIITMDSYEYAISCLLQHLKTFDDFIIERFLQALNLLLEKFPLSSQTDWVLHFLVEYISFSSFLGNEVALAFQVFTNAKFSSKIIIDLARIIFHSGYEFISGKEWGFNNLHNISNISIFDVNIHVKEWMKNHLFDLLTEPVPNNLILKAPLTYLFSLPIHSKDDSINEIDLTVQEILEIVDHFFFLYPVECTDYFVSRYLTFPTDIFYSFFGTIDEKLKFISDPLIQAKWMKIALSIPDYQETETIFENIKAFFIVIALDHFQNSKLENSEIDAIFAEYIAKNYKSEFFIVQSKFSELSNVSKISLINSLKNIGPTAIQFLLKAFPEISSYPTSNSIQQELTQNQNTINFQQDLITKSFSLNSNSQTFTIEQAIQTENLYFIKEAILKEQCSDIFMKIRGIPDNLAEKISNILSELNLDVIPLTKVSTYLRSPWRSLALSTISKHFSEFFHQTFNEHLKKSEILDLCSSIVQNGNYKNIIDYGLSEFPKINSLKRSFVILRLLSVAIESHVSSNKNTKDILLSIMNNFNQENEIDLYELGRLIYFSSEHIDIPISILAQLRNPIFLNILPCRLVLVHSNGTTKEDDIYIYNKLMSGHPSLKMKGMLFLEDGCDDEKNLKCLIESDFLMPIIGQFNAEILWKMSQTCKSQVLRSVCSQRLQSAAGISFNSPAFTLACRHIDNLSMNAVDQILQVTDSIDCFDIAIHSINSFLRKISYEDQNLVLMDKALLWLSAHPYSHYQTHCLNQWSHLLHNILGPQTQLSILCCQFLPRIQQFYAILCEIAVTIKEIRDSKDNSVAEYLSMAKEMIQNPEQQQALANLMNEGQEEETVRNYIKDFSL